METANITQVLFNIVDGLTSARPETKPLATYQVFKDSMTMLLSFLLVNKEELNDIEF